MELINKIRKSRKGFTLVEIIVVLVILAVLAAFTIPAMLGFVNEARGKAMIAEAREVYVAAQATATEYRAMNTTAVLSDANLATDLGSQDVGAMSNGANPATTATGASLQMRNYLVSDIDISTEATAAAAKTKDPSDAFWTVTLNSTAGSGKVATVVYSRNSYKVTITDGSSTVEKF